MAEPITNVVPDEITPSSQPANTNKRNKFQQNFRFGRKKLEIPLSKEKLNEKVIQRYLPSVLAKFMSNASDYHHLYDVYKGDSFIRNKTRDFDSPKQNSIVDEHHIYSQVEFKKGYMYGDDVKYSCSDESKSTDDITWLNKYMKDQKKSRKNIDIAEDVYVCGSGNRIILPKQRGAKYDLNINAPFDIYNLDYCSSFIVYSSNYTKEKLFGCIITTIDCDNPEDTQYELMIYDYLHSYRFSCTTLKGLGIGDIRFIKKSKHYIGYCPFVEFKANKARMGIVEVVEPLFDAVNTITSNTLDNIVDVVGGILVIINNTITGQDKKQVDETGSLTLHTVDPSKPVDARYLINQLQYGEVNLVREELIKTAYNIVGVPQATTQSTSGGDTGQARMLGGGWSRADIVAKQDEPCLKEAETEMLEIAISICNKQPDCKINDLYANDIEVNFCRNKNDNLLVKTQSLQTLVGMNVPKETALNIVELTANPHEVAIEWQSLNDSIEEKNKEMEYKKEQLGGNESGLQKETEKETKEIE